MVVTSSSPINHYYSEAGRLLIIAEKYSQRVALRQDLLSDSPTRESKAVFSRYYRRDMSALERTIDNSQKQFEWQVLVFNAACRLYGSTEVTKTDILLELLCDSARRDFYKSRFAEAKGAQTVRRLQDIEKDFRSISAQPSP